MYASVTSERVQTILFVVISAGIALLFAFHAYPYDSETVYPFTAPPQENSVLPSVPVTVTFAYSGRPITGVKLYAANTESASAVFDGILLDSRNTVLATKARQYTEYRKSGDPVITVLFAGEVQVKRKEELTLKIISREEFPIVLRAMEEEEGASPPKLVLSTLHAQNVAFGTRQGALIGLAVAYCFLIIHLLRRASPTYQWIAAALTVVVAAILICIPYIYRPNVLGINDWDYRYSLSHIYSTTLSSHHQLPLWNPYICGGTAALGDPEFALFTPTFLLQYVFGVEQGTGYSILLGFVLTGLGALLLARGIGLPALESTLAATILMFSSTLILKATEGHVTIIFAFMWVPWILWAWLKKRPLHCGLFLSLVILQGGIYVLSYTILALGILTLLHPRRLEAIRITALAGLWMLGLSAFQLVPTLYWLAEHPDEAFVGSTVTLWNLQDIFLGRHLQHTFILQDQVSDWHEYGAYIGYGVLFLTLIGMSKLAQSRVVLILGIGLLLSLLISSSGPYLTPLLEYISYIPRSNISRLVIFTVLCAALLSGFGMKKLKRVSGLWWSLPLVCIAFITIDLASLAYPIAEQAFSLPSVSDHLPPAHTPIEYTEDTHTFRQEGLDMPRSYPATVQGYGTFSFCGVLSPRAAVRTITSEDPHPSYIRSIPEGEVRLLSWSPNRVALHVDTGNGVDIRLNANYARGWHTSLGELRSNEGALAVRIPAKTNDIVVLQYMPPGRFIGFGVTVVTILLVITRYVLPFLRKRLRATS